MQNKRDGALPKTGQDCIVTDITILFPKKTTQHRKEIESLTKIIQEKDEEIQYWKKKYYGSAADILALKAYYGMRNRNKDLSNEE